ncbi:Dehydrogenase/reductase SDR family member 7 like protein [Argiope bruennichi]|uniref:Dehydrogenase/reductase SDR family member 7 like protein n=1 Tax=Argiope bruennichi TaxID=94029 RepID=A0A8T0G1W5_ARGBR|nr:Dehydrogenase/reductase SDR family member 7 like protein [Argiope bruennichi]
MLYADADLTLLYYHSLNRPRDFHNKVVWITGASSGIGEHLAYVLVKLGAKLALSGVNIERLTSVGKRCKEISNCAAEDILLVPFQINKFEDHDECVKKVLDHFGQGYFECLRNETLDENIKVTLVCPGPVFSGLVERCVTGNGEKYGHKQQPTDKKMSTERCCDLIATAIAYQLDECWISMQPILFTYYMAQYIPTIFRTFIGKFLFNKERVMKMRQGRIFLFLLYADADLTLLFHHYLNRPRDFRNKVVWITGASSGIGERLAYTLVKLGAKLALSGVNVERLTAVGERCKKISNCAAEDILLVPFQIERFELHDECVKKVLDHFGQIDILINNAGRTLRANFVDTDIAVDQQLFNINVFGTINLTRKVLKHFLERKKGHIVINSSITGKLGMPYSCTYSGSKHALHGYFESLKTDLVDENINFTLVCPGPVFSGVTESSLTGKIDEKSDLKQKATDIKMTTERCCDLMATAIAYQLDECWISLQPFLLIFYIGQYIPTKLRTWLITFIIQSYYKETKKCLAKRSDADSH